MASNDNIKEFTNCFVNGKNTIINQFNSEDCVPNVKFVE